VPAGSAWLHEPKLDGFRLQIVKQGRQVTLYSRNGHDWSERLPVLVDPEGHSMPIGDNQCRVVPPRRQGRARLPQTPWLRRRRHELVVYAFDLCTAMGRTSARCH
jgi:bifunctional non-homologous end joining protein LigD